MGIAMSSSETPPNLPQFKLKNDGQIPEEMADEVLALASRLYTEQLNSYSLSQLIEAGSEAQIPPEFVAQAMQELQERKIRENLAKQERENVVKQSLAIVAGTLLAGSVWVGWTYNTIASSENQVAAQWAQVENQLQRRADLIPNLVEITQAYAQQERELIALLLESRQAYLNAVTPEQKQVATERVDRAIAQFQVYVRAHPQLQSSQLFSNLQYELAGTENRIATERRRYNLAVQQYNQRLSTFPNNWLNQWLGFEKKSFFEADNSAVPDVRFDAEQSP
jgi:LemA protein